MYEITAIALDPGITTGYASGYVHEGQLKVVTGQAKWSHMELYNQFVVMRPNWIIIEKFEFRQESRKGLELYPRELIGVTKLYVEQFGNDVTLVEQQPSSVKFAFPDKLLEAEGLYKPGKPHSNDAARHMLQWFTYGPGYQFNKKGYTSGA